MVLESRALRVFVYMAMAVMFSFATQPFLWRSAHTPAQLWLSALNAAVVAALGLIAWKRIPQPGFRRTAFVFAIALVVQSVYWIANQMRWDTSRELPPHLWLLGATVAGVYMATAVAASSLATDWLTPKQKP